MNNEILTEFFYSHELSFLVSSDKKLQKAQYFALVAKQSYYATVSRSSINYV